MSHKHSRDWDSLHEGVEEYGDQNDRETYSASYDTHISDSNIGSKILGKWGWKEGEGLGKAKDGRSEPVKVAKLTTQSGLGRERHMHEMAMQAAQRPLTEHERQIVETEEMKEIRMEKAKKEAAVTHFRETTGFKCDLCQKTYKRVGELETHLDSYEHHHRKRIVELKEMTRSEPTEADTKMKEEREKRIRAKELKELERRAALLASAEKEKEKQKEKEKCSKASSSSATTTAAGTGLIGNGGGSGKRAAISFGFGFGVKGKGKGKA